MEVPNTSLPSVEFTFCIYYIEKMGFLGYKISSKKVVKCVIDSNGIRTDRSFKEGMSSLNIHLNSVVECQTMLLHDTSPYLGVSIKTDTNLSIRIVPVNPFDPSSFFHHNEDEAKAMVAVINSLRINQYSDYESNPYYRQLKQRDTPKIVQGLQERWDEEISPWEYYLKYQSSTDKKRRIINIISVFFYIISLIGIIIYSIWKLYL
jgi:hypothetical protein